jgi:hypothetical protein
LAKKAEKQIAAGPKFEDAYMKSGAEFIKLPSSACQQVYLAVGERLQEEKRKKKEDKKRKKKMKDEAGQCMKSAKNKMLALNAFGAGKPKPDLEHLNVEDKEGADVEGVNDEVFVEEEENSSDDSDDSSSSIDPDVEDSNKSEIYVARPIKKGVPMRRIIQGSLIREAIRASVNDQVPREDRADFFSAKNKKRCQQLQQRPKMSVSLPALESPSPKKYKQDKRAARIEAIKKQLARARSGTKFSTTSIQTISPLRIHTSADPPSTDLRTRLQMAHERSHGISFQEQIEQTHEGPIAAFGRMDPREPFRDINQSVFDLESQVFRMGLGNGPEYQ